MGPSFLATLGPFFLDPPSAASRAAGPEALREGRMYASRGVILLRTPYCELFGVGVVGCGEDEPEPVVLGGVRGWLLVAVGEESLLAVFV